MLNDRESRTHDRAHAGPKGHGSARRRWDAEKVPGPWRQDERGSIQVIEAIMVASMVAAAIFTVATFDVPVTKTEGIKADNEQLVEDSLKALYHRSSTYNSGQTFGSMLEQYVLEALAGDTRNLQAYLNKSLPRGAQYNVFLDTGFGDQRRLVYAGEPPREAVASTYPFVPRLAYTFLKPAFSHYHGDFGMSLTAVPVYHGLLARDEGESMELTVTYKESDGSGPFTTKTYGQTALRKNIDTARSWPSASIYVDDAGAKTHFVDGSDAILLIDYIQGYSYDTYSIDWSMKIEETAGEPLPRGTEIRLDFPRLWWFDDTDKRDEMTTGASNNSKYWEDFEWEGNHMHGVTIKAHLIDDLVSDHRWFNITGDYIALIDTAYPYFSPVTVSLGDGGQGLAQIVVKNPTALNVTSVMNREARTSMPKPITSGDTSTWGMVFMNTGGSVMIQNVQLRNPEGLDLLDAVVHAGGTTTGSWTEPEDGRHIWTPSVQPTVTQGQVLWLAMTMTATTSNDNDYRAQDYLDSQYHFSSLNTTDTNNIEVYNYSKRAWLQDPEWAFHDRVQPYDDCVGCPTGAYGWADEAGNTYWVTSSSYYNNNELIGNTTYTVLPTGASSNTFGEYRGAHAHTEVRLFDDVQPERSFALGETTYIKNNFTAIFTALSTLDAISGIDIGDDITVSTRIYSPERAWKDLPTETYVESVSGVAPALDDITILMATDISGDGVRDMIIVDANNAVTALDGRDGVRFWRWTPASAVSMARLADVDRDGQKDVVLALTDGTLLALDTTPSGLTSTQRQKWSLALEHETSSAAATIKDVEFVGDGTAGTPDLLVSSTWSSESPQVLAIEVTSSTAAKVLERHTLKPLPSQTDHLTAGMPDILPIKTAASAYIDRFALSTRNQTVTMFDVATFAPLWLETVSHVPHQLASADLDGDGVQELVVNTEGREIIVLNGTEGRYGPIMRGSTIFMTGWTGSPGATDVVASAVLPTGRVIAVDAGAFILQDPDGLYAPEAFIPSKDPSYYDEDFTDLFGLAPLEFSKSWVAAQAIGSEAYIVASDGEIRRNTTTTGQFFLWQTMKSAGAGAYSPNFTHAWVDADLKAGGAAYGIDLQGTVARAGDGLSDWTKIGAVCSDGHVNSALTCEASKTKVFDVLVETHANGTADRILVVVNLNETVGGKDGKLLAFDPDTDTWSVLFDFSDRVTAIDKDDQGRYYILGDHMYIADAASPSGPWTAHTVHGGTTSENTLATDIDMITPSEGYAISSTVRAWAYEGNRVWQPIIVDPGSSTRFSHIMTDNDGQPWLFGDGYTLTPLTAYQRTAYAYYTVDVSNFSSTPQWWRLRTLEGAFGSDGGTTTTTTLVNWDWRRAGDTAWNAFAGTDDTVTPGVKPQDRTASTTCGVLTCDTIELRATLRQRINDGGLGAVRAHPSTSPTVETLIMTGESPLGSEVFNATIDLSTLSTTSTAVTTDFHGGIRLPPAGLPWAFRDTDVDGTDRRVAGTGYDVDGTSGDELLLFMSTSTQLFGGQSGALVDEQPAWSIPSQHLITDMTGDGKNDLVAAFSSANVQVWDLNADVVDSVTGAGGGTVAAMAEMSRDEINRSVAFAGNAGTIWVAQNVTSDVSPLAIILATSPSQTQGRVTFAYTVPDNALFGVYFAVSEVSWEITEGTSQTITQTARLVQWFDVVPPDRKMPNPPIYEIELVSWFNEL